MATKTVSKAQSKTAKAKSRKSDHVIVGAHCNGGLKGAVDKATEIGAEAIQIFIGSPQTWKIPSPKHTELLGFGQEVKKKTLGPVFVHGSYLVNLAAATKEHHARSVESLRTVLFLSEQAGAEGLIFHPGSAKGGTYKEAMAKVIDALEKVLDGYKGNCRLLLEVCAGQGETIGDKFSEFREVLEEMGHDKRLGVCWDTCHLFNAGYDVASADGLKRTIAEFEDEIGFEWLYAIHANDSKNPLGARKDRHENIGKGFIGEAGFKRMLNHPKLRALPWILEVPGFEKKGPDKANIEILRRLANN